MNDKPSELSESLYSEIKFLCSKGDELADAGRFDNAISCYGMAWRLIPEPKSMWNASTWVLAAIADASFLSGKYDDALAALENALKCPGGIGNSFIHLRYGQVLLDRGLKDQAADELMRAYMGGGDDIFAHEDPRYIDFLKTRAVI